MNSDTAKIVLRIAYFPEYYTDFFGSSSCWNLHPIRCFCVIPSFWSHLSGNKKTRSPAEKRGFPDMIGHLFAQEGRMSAILLSFQRSWLSAGTYEGKQGH
jgi:hypothetical protein